MTATTWTCWECFGTVVDDDNDGIGYCRDCNMIVGPDGRAVGRSYAWPWPTAVYESVADIHVERHYNRLSRDGIWLAR